ncbi:phage holin [Lysinibacillus sp. HST-98]|uniref:phage holin n=1 Tax=Lysinibacillus sp. HST-98 TaxID=2800419 RepID=UPI001926DF43|nr:phage holin [Lysinibacillus sp. HST-98]MBL3731540.1 phage holin [Lysinibacillus sp. HST-98]
MKINWKVRFKNKTFLLSLWALIIVLAHQIASIWGADITLVSAQVTNVVETVLTILALIGIVHDPTTPGINDSERALKYDKPKGDK